MDCKLKTEIGLNFFNLIASCFGKLAKTLIMVYCLLENSPYIFLLVFYKHFVFDNGLCNLLSEVSFSLPREVRTQYQAVFVATFCHQNMSHV